MPQPSEPWYASYFGQAYLDVYDYRFTAERTEREVDFVLKTLALGPGAELLDLCCAQGRHALLLARRGLRVTAQDMNRDFLQQVEAAAAREGLAIETVQSDMRLIPFEARFDAVQIMFTSFGYLESDEEDAKVLAAVARSLKPGAYFFLDQINRDWVLLNWQPKDWRTMPDGTVYLEERSFEPATGRNHVTFAIVRPDGRREETSGHHIRLYTLTEVIRMLAEAGLRFEAAYGDFDGAAFRSGSRFMLVVARKLAA